MIKNKLSDYKPREDKFWGIYRGVVEDRNDPDKLGRCRIRVFGIHDDLLEQDEQQGIPTDQLPWAEPVMGLVEGSMSGYGQWSVPLHGTHVMVFFENGNWMQPRFFATVPGKPESAPDTSKGFNDPDGVYPTETRDGTWPHLQQPINESDVHRLARNESIDETVVQHKNDNLDLEIKVADKTHEATDTTWDEPESAYEAEYPNNIVIATHGGHVLEIDNTEGKERFHIYHPSHSYTEVDHEGNVIIRNEKDKYEVVIGNKNIHIKQTENKTIDVDKTLRVGNDKVDWVGNDEDRFVGRDHHESIVNDETRDVGHDHFETIGNNETRDVGNDVVEDIGNDETRTVGNDCSEEIGNDWTVMVGGNIHIEATGNVTIIGARIDLNP